MWDVTGQGSSGASFLMPTSDEIQTNFLIMFLSKIEFLFNDTQFFPKEMYSKQNVNILALLLCQCKKVVESGRKLWSEDRYIQVKIKNNNNIIH